MVDGAAKTDIALWDSFQAQERLTTQEREQFERYAQLLCEWNARSNLTRIIDLADILTYHFQDSVAVCRFLDLSARKGICDIGAGGGFPGVPLSILYPQVPMVLLEVNKKKVAFLNAVTKELGLENCIVCDFDWRTFLRKVPYSMDLFVARASLQLEELVRAFSPSCAYNDAQLIYWASQHWEPGEKETQFLERKESYELNNQKRYYAFFRSY